MTSRVTVSIVSWPLSSSAAALLTRTSTKKVYESQNKVEAMKNELEAALVVIKEDLERIASVL